MLNSRLFKVAALWAGTIALLMLVVFSLQVQGARSQAADDSTLEVDRASAAEQATERTLNPQGNPNFVSGGGYELFVSMDDPNGPALLVDPPTGLTQLAFNGIDVWGAAYDYDNNRVFFSSGGELWEWPVGGTPSSFGTVTDSTATTVVMEGLAYYEGTLYASKLAATGEGEGIYEVDWTTQTASLVIPSAIPANTTISGIDIDPATGIMYGVNDATAQRGLVQINLDGTVTVITDYVGGETDVDGLAVGDGRAYLITDDDSPPWFEVWDLAMGQYVMTVTNPFTTSEIFAAGAWISEFTPPPSLSCGAAPVTFDSGLPADWTVNTPTGPVIWSTTDDTVLCGNGYEAGGTPPGACADADQTNQPGDPYDAQLLTNSFDLSTGVTSADMELQWRHRPLNGSVFNIDISTDGGANWTNVFTNTAGNPGGANGDFLSIDLDPFVGNSDVMARYRFFGDAWDWYVHLDDISLACGGTGFEPDIAVEPASVVANQIPDVVTTEPMTISNEGNATLDWTVFEEEGTAPAGPWSDNFDSYANDSQIHGQGGWKGWLNDPAAGAFVRDDQARSAPHSLEIMGPSDPVHEFSGYTSGQWTFTTWQYIPSTLVGDPYFIMLNTYNDGGSGLNWSVTVQFLTGTDTVFNTGVSGGTLPIIYDEWVELRVEIDLDNDTQDFYYGGQLLYSGTWTNEVSGGGALNIGVVDLYANSSSPVYYDDLSLAPAGGGGGCTVPGDIPWASVDPTAGSNTPGSSAVVDVTLDSTGLTPGVYTGNLCVSSNDPDEPVVTVPVELTVDEPPAAPDIELDPTSFAVTVTVDTQETEVLDVSNVGTADLNWTIEEQPPAAAPTGPAAVNPAAEPQVKSPADCAQFANYAGREPEGYARFCTVPVLPTAGDARTMRDPSDIAYALDIGFVSDNFISHELGNFPGQTVHGANTRPIFAMDFDETATTLYAIDNTTREFGTLDLSSGTFTTIAVVSGIPVADNISGLTIDPADGTAYVSAIGAFGMNLHTFNLTTGAATLIGNEPSTPLMIDIAIGPQGVMYGHEIGVDAIYTIDTATGAATLVGPTGVLSNFAQGMDFDNEDGTLYAYTYQGGGAQTYGTIDLATGALTPLATTPQGEFEGATQTIMAPTIVCNPGDIPWLSVNPAAGTTAPGATTPVDVTFDATGLATGVYTGTLCVNSDDPIDPLLFVPITMTVVEEPPPPPVPQIMLVKTVGTDPTVCAEVDVINVPAGTEVTYCYEVTNTGTVTATTHDLTDSELGDLLTGYAYDLAPGASLSITATAVITEDTTNTAIWTAYAGDEMGTAQDSATVMVLEEGPDENLMYLPLIYNGGAEEQPVEAAPVGVARPAGFLSLLLALPFFGLVLRRK